MKAEEKVKLLSEELKQVNAKIIKNNDAWSSIDQSMESAYDTGDYDLDDYNGWISSKNHLIVERNKLAKQQGKLVKKLSRIISRHKIGVDEETGNLLK